MDAGLQLIQGHPEIDHGPHGLQMIDRAFPADHAAAGGDDAVVTADRAHRALLRVQKIGYAPAVQDVLEQGVLLLLDDQVGVKKAAAQRLGQQDAHSALSGAWHPNQCDVAHSPIPLMLLW